MKQENVIFRKIGINCQFPYCGNSADISIKMMKEEIYLCNVHKGKLKNKLGLKFVEVNSRVYNKRPPKFKKLAEDYMGKKVKSRTVISPRITSTKTWKKLSRKEKEGVFLNRVVKEIGEEYQRIKNNAKSVKTIEPAEQKTYTALKLEEKENKK